MAVTAGNIPDRGEPVFVGRAREHALFQDAFDRMIEGRCQVLMLLGEPGIGKTRCAEAFAEAAEEQGALVLWGRCYEEPGAPPYWPWVQVLRGYLAASSENEMQLALGRGVQDIAALLPELGAEPRRASVEPDGEPAEARFRTFDAVSRLLINAAQQVPLLLVLDNLHWADAPSLSLLEFVNHELAASRIMLVGAYRDSEVLRHTPLLQTLGDLSRDSRLHRVRLSGLDEQAITALSHRMLGRELPERVITAINDQTDGNPLFVIELLKVLVEESDDAGVEPIAVRIPDRCPRDHRASRQPPVRQLQRAADGRVGARARLRRRRGGDRRRHDHRAGARAAGRCRLLRHRGGCRRRRPVPVHTRADSRNAVRGDRHARSPAAARPCGRRARGGGRRRAFDGVDAYRASLLRIRGVGGRREGGRLLVPGSRGSRRGSRLGRRRCSL